jgi:putative membrane protein
MIVGWVLNALAIFAAAYLLPGVLVDGFVTALLLSFILGFINVLLKPLLILLTLPITILTLGLFLFVINALMIMLAANFVPGFTVDGFWWALLFSLVLSALNVVFQGVRR